MFRHSATRPAALRQHQGQKPAIAVPLSRCKTLWRITPPVRLRVPAARIAYDSAPVSTWNGATVAQKVQTLLIDDLDGSAADGTVRLGLDGTEYEIDLNAGHAQELRDVLARYVKAARRVGGGRPARSGRRGPAGRVDSTEVREWAKAQGIDVKDRGRVSAGLVAKFKAATEK